MSAEIPNPQGDAVVRAEANIIVCVTNSGARHRDVTTTQKVRHTN